MLLFETAALSPPHRFLQAQDMDIMSNKFLESFFVQLVSLCWNLSWVLFQLMCHNSQYPYKHWSILKPSFSNLNSICGLWCHTLITCCVIKHFLSSSLIYTAESRKYLLGSISSTLPVFAIINLLSKLASQFSCEAFLSLSSTLPYPFWSQRTFLSTLSVGALPHSFNIIS